MDFLMLIYNFHLLMVSIYVLPKTHVLKKKKKNLVPEVMVS